MSAVVVPHHLRDENFWIWFQLIYRFNVFFLDNLSGGSGVPAKRLWVCILITTDFRQPTKTNGGERGVIRGAPAMVLGKYGKGIVLAISVLAKSSIKANVCPPPKTTPPNQRNSFADEREQQR